MLCREKSGNPSEKSVIERNISADKFYRLENVFYWTKHENKQIEKVNKH
jgi:hypothetical protein